MVSVVKVVVIMVAVVTVVIEILDQELILIMVLSHGIVSLDVLVFICLCISLCSTISRNVIVYFVDFFYEWICLASLI